MAFYSADLETTTDPKDCRVWASGVCDISKPDDITLSNNLDDLMSFMQTKGGTYYFHNLRFDGNFLLYWLFTHNYRWKYCTKMGDRKNMEPGEFTTMISNMGQWYSICIKFYPTKTGQSELVEVLDSSKLIPMSVASIPKAFGFGDIAKGEIDYNEYRAPGHELTEQEKSYLNRDVAIVARGLSFMKSNGQTKMTSASNALNDFRKRWDPKKFKRMFPALNDINDEDIRLSYKGGWTYLNPKYKNKLIGVGSVYDVNSMYPWAMKYCLLPYGDPVWFSGEYDKKKYGDTYPLYIINIVAEFRLKPGHYPSIQIKPTPGNERPPYPANEYIAYSLKPEALVLTSVDYELFLENYDVDIYEVNGGYMFTAMHGIFDDYIDYWYDVKTQAKKDGNKGMERIAKLMLNSLYGKFGARKKGKYKIPYYDKDANIVKYKNSEEEEDRKGGYLPIATFITSYCRDKIIRAANLCGDRFIYADTDSVHIKGLEPVDGLDVDEYRLGAFKLEEQFKRGKFIRQKTYLEIYDKLDDEGEMVEVMNLKACGMPDKMKASVTEDDFYEGAVFDPKEGKYAPKLMPRVVPGGVILRETTFQIKKADSKNTSLEAFV